MKIPTVLSYSSVDMRNNYVPIVLGVKTLFILMSPATYVQMIGDFIFGSQSFVCGRGCRFETHPSHPTIISDSDAVKHALRSQLARRIKIRGRLVNTHAGIEKQIPKIPVC